MRVDVNGQVEFLGNGDHACEAALAHTVRDKTEAAYNRTDLFERRRKLMGAWATFATAKVADVVSLHA